ncbi:GNAT family N-acetyltransferase [Paenibacillus sp. NFR01]|uniref:GNAT family N-acetyltransferase n=1 Tax=Paenibacillus sp. NFR01 TaxID=1566279 RepID=UPI0008BE4360|nr:GNAT family N-acetyltransferase [Paenibacillus sp. NFR01]SEU19548.1 Ribosomal protein S18 acetylase RimI [Paenibacillus sp. NFR01]
MTTIRMATEEDAAALSELNVLFNGVERDPPGVINSLRHSNELVAVAVDGNTVVGFACAQFFQSFCYSELQGEITEMYVREEARGNGYAQGLIRCLEEELAKRGADSVKILTSASNGQAQKAYSKAGYAVTTEAVMTKSMKEEA